jgi:hypothetical protein
VAKNKKLEALAVERIEYEVVVRTWIGKVRVVIRVAHY